MGPNRKSSSKFTLFQVFIALCFATRLVDAELPNEDFMKAVACMRQFFGENIAIEYFRSAENTLTDGEYSGVLCQQTYNKDLYQAIENHAEGDYDGFKIRGCLEEMNSLDLFQKYEELGQSLAETNYETPEQVDQLQASGSQQTNDETVEQVEHVEGSESQPTTSTTDQKLYTPAMNFKRGACLSEMKTVDFSELIDEQDKAVTLQCLAKCTSNFIFRIQNLLYGAREEAVNSSTIGLDNIQAETLYTIPHESMEFTKEKFNSELEEATEPLSINLISEIGKQYFIAYHELYYNLDEHRTDEIKVSDTEMGYLDYNLHGMYQTYLDCTQVGCAMAHNSIPLYDLIEAGADGDESIALKPFENGDKKTKTWVNLHITNWQRFCSVFKSEE